MEKTCASERESVRKWGAENARKIHQRLAELRAADTLEDVTALPGLRCHQLTADRAGQFAVDVKQPFRLIFEPAHDPVPRKEDGGVDLKNITAVRIPSVEDYHGG